MQSPSIAVIDQHNLFKIETSPKSKSLNNLSSDFEPNSSIYCLRTQPHHETMKHQLQHIAMTKWERQIKRQKRWNRSHGTNWKRRKTQSSQRRPRPTKLTRNRRGLPSKSGRKDYCEITAKTSDKLPNEEEPQRFSKTKPTSISKGTARPNEKETDSMKKSAVSTDGKVEASEKKKDAVLVTTGFVISLSLPLSLW